MQDEESIVGDMVEIREFVSAEGVELSSEVVKLSEETKGMKRGDMSQLDDVMEKLQESLHMSPEKGLELDEHARFVRELALISHSRETGSSGNEGLSDLDFLDKLEQQEEAFSQDEGKHVFAATSSGWKKGFLSGGGSKVPEQAKAKRAVHFSPAMSSSSVVSAIASSSSSVESHTTPTITTSQEDAAPLAAPATTSTLPEPGVIHSTIDSKSTASSGLPPARPVAFSGVIKERF